MRQGQSGAEREERARLVCCAKLHLTLWCSLSSDSSSSSALPYLTLQYSLLLVYEQRRAPRSLCTCAVGVRRRLFGDNSWEFQRLPSDCVPARTCEHVRVDEHLNCWQNLILFFNSKENRVELTHTAGCEREGEDGGVCNCVRARVCVCVCVCDSNPPVVRPNLKWGDEHSSTVRSSPWQEKRQTRTQVHTRTHARTHTHTKRNEPDAEEVTSIEKAGNPVCTS